MSTPMRRISKVIYMKKINSQLGFSLVELSVVIVIIGVLAAFAVPKFRDSVERSKASEAINYLSSIRTAQERYLYIESTYADDLANLDIKFPTPKYFSVGEFLAGDTGNLEDSWRLTLTRTGPSAGYGEYTITYGENGVVADESSLTDTPSINPLAN